MQKISIHQSIKDINFLEHVTSSHVRKQAKREKWLAVWWKLVIFQKNFVKSKKNLQTPSLRFDEKILEWKTWKRFHEILQDARIDP